MSKDETFWTNYINIRADEEHPASKPVDYIFLSFDRNLEGEELANRFRYSQQDETKNAVAARDLANGERIELHRHKGDSKSGDKA